MRLAAMHDVEASIAGHRVLNGTDLSLDGGEVVALVGRNGAGKTSAMRAMLGLMPITHGFVLLDGVDLRTLSPAERALRAAYLPQERRITWNMPAVEVVALATPFLSGQEGRRRAQSALRDMGIAHLADRGVAEMSGGERARVLIARAVNAPGRAIFLDEPVAGLDPDAQHFLLGRLRSEAAAGRAVMISMHDLTLAGRYADRVAVMKEGLVISDAVPALSLAPEFLRAAFGVEGVWIDGPAGPVLAVRRPQGA